MVDQPNKDQRLDKVLEIIMSDTKDISIGALAGSVSLSVSRLQHLFKCTVGCSIRSHRKEVRLDRAASLIAQTNRSIKDVMFSVGFHDPSHFAKAFREKYTVSPAEYRHQGVSILGRRLSPDRLMT